MKYYTGVVALALIVVFFLGLSYIGKLSDESKIQQQIDCIKAGGKVQTFPYSCINKD